MKLPMSLMPLTVGSLGRTVALVACVALASACGGSDGPSDDDDGGGNGIGFGSGSGSGSGSSDDDDGSVSGPGPGGGSTVSCSPGASDPVCVVMSIVNDERAAAGLPPYTWNDQLALAAQLHAEDMAANGYFSHDSLDGRNFVDRCLDAGYTGSPRGENIALGQQTPESVMDSWMNSSGHRANILSDGSNEIGVGLHELHWVQVFGFQ